MDNKKGLSAVVTTLIIILLVLVAVGVIWVVMKNILSGGAEEIFLGKFTVDLKIKNVNLDNSTNSVSLRVKRNPGQGDLAGIKFIFNDGVNSEIFEEMNLTLEELGERSFSFTLSQLNINDILTISISPIYETASGKKIVGRVISVYDVKTGSLIKSSVTRGFSSSTVSAGEIVTVTLDVFVIGGETFYAIEEYIPTGWSWINHGGGNTSDPNILKWAVVSSAVDTTYTYTAQAPASTGIFDGIYMFEGFTNTVPTQGETTVTVI